MKAISNGSLRETQIKRTTEDQKDSSKKAGSEEKKKSSSNEEKDQRLEDFDCRTTHDVIPILSVSCRSSFFFIRCHDFLFPPLSLVAID